MGRRKTVIAAGATWILGFGVMNAFWFLSKHPQNLLGQWDYRAPVIGDGLLLPIAAGVLVSALDIIPRAAHERRIALAAGLFGAAVGAYSQWAWLRDPAPLPNWTLPEAHHFTLPGWYHAIFLAAASAYFSGAGMTMLWRVRSLRRTGDSRAAESLLGSPWAAVLFASLFGFTALAALDSAPSIGTVATQGSVTVLALAVVLSLSLLVWGFGPASLRAWRNIASGVAFALGLAWLTVDWRGTYHLGFGDVLVVGLIALALATQLVAWRLRHWALQTTIAAIWLLAGLNAAAKAPVSGWPDVWRLLLPITASYIAFAVLVLGLVEIPGNEPEGRILVFVLPVPLILVTVADWLARHPEITLRANVLELSFSAFVLVWLVKFGQRRFWITMHNDVRLPQGFILDSGFVSTWVTITCILVATAVGFLRAIDTAGPALGWDSPHRVTSNYPLRVAAVVGVALLFAAFAAWTSKPRSSSPDAYLLRPSQVKNHVEFMRPGLSVPRGAWSLAMLGTLAWLLMPGAVWLSAGLLPVDRLSMRPDAFSWIVIILSAFIAIWLIATSFLNLWGCAAQIEFYRLGKKEMALVWLTSASVGTSAFWLLVVGLWSNHRLVRLLDIAALAGLVVLGSIVVTVGATAAITRSTPMTGAAPRYLSLHHPATNVGQDHLLHGYLLIFAVTTLFLAYRLSEVGIGSWAAVIFAIFPLMAGYGDQTFFTKDAYAQHIRSERRRGRQRPGLRARVQDTGCPEHLEPCKEQIEQRARQLNQRRCDAIQRRAELINILALTLAPPLLGLKLASRVTRRIQDWAFRGTPTTWHLSDTELVYAIGKRQDLFLPNEVLRMLGLKPGRDVAFVIDDMGTVCLQPAEDEQTPNLTSPDQKDQLRLQEGNRSLG